MLENQLVTIYCYGLEKTVSSDGTNISVWRNRTSTGSRSRSGTSLPGWRQRIALGADATTVFVGTHYRASNIRPYHWSATTYNSYTGIKTQESGEGFLAPQMPGDPASVDSTGALRDANRKFVNKAFSKVSAFSGSTFVAELKDTIRGLKQPLKGLREGLTHYHAKAKKLKRLGKAGFQKALSETWLEFQFHWKPLSNDIDSGMENLARFQETPDVIKVRSRGKSALVLNRYQTSNDSLGSINTTVDNLESAEVDVFLSGAIRPDFPSFGWRSWGFGTQDFIPAVWEAIPYSFAIDYFSNAGDVINAYSLIFFNTGWLSRTIRQVRKVESTGTGFAVSTGGFISEVERDVYGLGAITTARSRVLRAPLPLASVIPTLSLELPGAGSKKWLNLAALARLKTL